MSVVLSRDGEQIGISKKYLGPISDTNTGKVVEPVHSAGIRTIVPTKDTEIIPGIIDPKAVSMEIFKYLPWIIYGEEYFNGVRILVTRNDGTQYSMGIQAPVDVMNLIPLPILDNAPIYDRYLELIPEKGILITGTTPIMKTNMDNATVDFVASRISPSIHEAFFSEIQLFQSSNGKILLLQP